MVLRGERGQAAIEYLSTYGWVLLIVLVSLGALVYFGVIDVAKYLPSHCEFEAGIFCSDYKMSEDGLTIVLVNSYGEDLENVSVQVFAGDCNETIEVGDFFNKQKERLDFCASTSFPDRLKGELLVKYQFKHEHVFHTNRGTFTLWYEG